MCKTKYLKFSGFCLVLNSVAIMSKKQMSREGEGDEPLQVGEWEYPKVVKIPLRNLCMTLSINIIQIVAASRFLFP